jgi:hypothetical protein
MTKEDKIRAALATLEEAARDPMTDLEWLIENMADIFETAAVTYQSISSDQNS